MKLRIVRRGLVTLVAAGFLGLTGAAPASAQELGWFERGVFWISELWATPDAGLTDRAAEPRGTELKGMGLDPNGGVLPPPDGGGGNGDGGNGNS